MGSQGIIENGRILVEGNRIVAVGKQQGCGDPRRCARGKGTRHGHYARTD